MLNGLDLFSGIGGISLALEPWVRPVAYCENERYAQAVLLSRMRDGGLPVAPIWDDVRTLNGSDLPPIDIIYGGFPCQDISSAGRGAGMEQGDRSGLFFEIMRLTQEVRPTFVFLENVPAIRTRGLSRVLSEFTALGYDCRWTVVSAADVGAPHLRKRWFLLAADSHAEALLWASQQRSESHRTPERRKAMADSQNHGNGRRFAFEESGESSGHVADSNSIRGREGRTRSEIWQRQPDPFCGSWWSAEPDVGGMADELSARLDRGGGLGDAEAKETGSDDFLRYLLKEGGAEAIERTTRGLNTLQAQKVLFAFMREYERGGRAPRAFVEGATTLKELLREMRKNRPASCSSSRREQVEQFFREYPDALRILSQLVASRSPTPGDHPLWECPVPRTAMNVPKRVDRLRGLGNAVVPLQARIAFERLMGI